MLGDRHKALSTPDPLAPKKENFRTQEEEGKRHNPGVLLPCPPQAQIFFFLIYYLSCGHANLIDCYLQICPTYNILKLNSTHLNAGL